MSWMRAMIHGRTSYLIFVRAGLCAALLLGVVPARAEEAVEISAGIAVRAELPDAPAMSGVRTGDGNADGAPSAAATGVVTGTVLDFSGALVPGAHVSLTGAPGGEKTAVSGSDGQFSFTGLAAGTYRVTVTATGMGSFQSSEVTLVAGERRELPDIFLRVASAKADVEVIVNQEQLATEQVSAALEQRVLGVLPNFYSSYIWNAAPLPAKQKYRLAFRSVTDPVAFVVAGAIAGAEQANNTFPGYGQGAEGFGKRYGATLADDVIGRFIGSAILPSVLHQDPRYFYRGSGSKKSRALYAISRAVVCRDDNGHTEPNYSYILGAFAAGGISNAYHPAGDRGAGLTIRNGFIDIGGHAASNLIREFVLRQLTSKVPDYEQGKR